ncbi:MAG: sugar kinase [Phycisphaerae bacterium]|nr:sugar kinase [Phycisphaerae bacterium]
MSLLVTGSIGIDTVSSPLGQVDGVLGGSAVYFAFSAGLFSPVRLVGVVGDDFPQEFRDVITARGLDLTGLECRTGSKTFRWAGSYQGDMNEATTLQTDLNVLAEAGPRIPDVYKDSRFVFLANTHPTLQRDLLGQLDAPELVVCDTMNLWINTELDSLKETLSLVHGVVINDAEARALAQHKNLVIAGRRILEWGPSFVVIKKGEHGSMLVTRDTVAVLPAYPTIQVCDPTGAGDSFAGGMMGYLASQGDASEPHLRSALARGTICASFAIEGFSLDGISCCTTAQDVEKRLVEYRKVVEFE